MYWVVLLVRGVRIDFPVNVGRVPGFGTDEQMAAARAAAMKAYPNALLLGVY